jgi:hypothetical protein
LYISNNHARIDHETIPPFSLYNLSSALSRLAAASCNFLNWRHPWHNVTALLAT